MLALQVLTALRFYASGSYQRSVGQDITVAIGQSAVSDCIGCVSKAICDALLTRYCSFPRSAEEIEHLKSGFAAISRMPGCIGAIDCTHIAIIAPSVPTYREAVYVNRKGYHSLNVQVVRSCFHLYWHALYECHLQYQPFHSPHICDEWPSG